MEASGEAEQRTVAGWSPKREALAEVVSLVRESHETASRGCTLRASGATYGNASIHFGVLLHRMLESPKESDRAGARALREAVWVFGNAESNETTSAAMKLLDAAPEFAWAPWFMNSTGVRDIASILATVSYGHADGVSTMAEYRRALKRLQSLFLVVVHQWNLNDGFKAACADLKARGQAPVLESHGLDECLREVKKEVQRNAFEGSFELDDEQFVPVEMRENLESSFSDLMPTPAGVVALAGPSSGRSAEVAWERLGGFVTALHPELMREMVARNTVLQEELDERDASTTTGSFALMVHLRVFLWNVASQLTLTMVRCDRVPALGPWYALIVLAVRGYAMVAARVAILEQPQTDAEQTYWLLRILALPMRSTQMRLPSALEDLLGASTRSSYEPLERQDGACWILLRAALSGLNYQQSLATGELVLGRHGRNKGSLARFGALCLLMRTEVALTILLLKRQQDGVSYEVVNGAKELSDIFELLAFATMPFQEGGARDQSVFEVVSTFIAGSADCMRLASPRFTFSDLSIVAKVWEKEMVLRNGKTSMGIDMGVAEEGAREENLPLHEQFLGQFQLVGDRWLEVISHKKKVTVDSDKGLQGVEAYDKSLKQAGFGHVQAEESVDGMITRLQRVAASPVRCHTAKWLEMAFDFAMQLERIHLVRTEKAYGQKVYLIRPPQNGMLPTLRGAATLRMNLRLRAEHMLHMARANGQCRAGNHVVLAAWFSTEQGPMLFARSITKHTVDKPYVSIDVDVDRSRGWLLSPRWINQTRARGEDSVQCAALEFSEALQRMLESNVKEVDTLKQRMQFEVGTPEGRERLRKAALGHAEEYFGIPRKESDEGALDREAAAAKAMLGAFEEKGFNDQLPFSPAVLDDWDARRRTKLVVEGPDRWAVPPYDKATRWAMALFHRCRANEEQLSKTRVCHTEFSDGFSVAVLTCAPQAEDLTPEQVSGQLLVEQRQAGKQLQQGREMVRGYVAGRPREVAE